MLASVIIRTYNEEKFLHRLIEGVRSQETRNYETEIVIVDSGSTDSTINIAKNKGCKVKHIHKNDFTFGRSLNVGCEYADGEYLVFISGHCIPASNLWLENLLDPLNKNICLYTYGRQLGHESTKYSECCLFDKHFPAYSKLPQEGFFCNNANAAIKKDTWKTFRFDEDLTGLEDMDLAKKIVSSGGSIGYVSEAPVYHIHNETWRQVRRRYEREAYALKNIMPEIHFHTMDLMKYYIAGVYEDSIAAVKEDKFLLEIKNILLFRLMHYWGTWRGHHEYRKLSNELKNRYFYPKDLEKDKHEKKNSGVIANEGQ